MSDTEELTVTIKAKESERYAGDAPWFVFKGKPKEIYDNIVTVFGFDPAVSHGGLVGITLAAQVSLNAEAAAVRGGLTPVPDQGTLTTPANVVTPPAGTWGAQPQATPQAAHVGGANFGGRPAAQLHPEGRACHCGKVLEYKTSSGGKGKWQCPDWRWNNGQPNNHAMEWQNQR